MYESRSGTDNAVLVARVVDLLAGGRAALVTDVDGTISQIQARPEQARVLPRARAALAGLCDLLVVVAVVSGRRAADARQMVDVAGVVYVGNHGLEVWLPSAQAAGRGPEIVAEARPWVARLGAVLDDVQRQVPEAGILIENKGVSGSLHYRLAADPDRARRDLLALLGRRALGGLRIEEGRMVINLLPPLSVTKGSAVTWLVEQYHLERIVYVGDDVTDAHAFRALHGLRQSGQAQTLSIGVVGASTPPSIRQLADASVPSVDAVADLLCEVLGGLKASAETAHKGDGDRPRASATMDGRPQSSGD